MRSGGLRVPGRQGGRLSVGALLGAAGLVVPFGTAGAEEKLPEVRVIATTPGSTTSRARPRPARSPPRPSAAATQSAPSDPSAIARDKVPSNTHVLTPDDFEHTRSTNLLDSLSR